LSSNNVVNWTRRAQIYHEVINLVGGAEDVAAASYLKAVELEPNNPFILASLARLYLSIADRAHSFKTSEQVDLAKQAAASETSSLASAEDYLRQAITLKNDYATAHYYLAAVYERQGRLKEAAGRLEALRDQIQNNLGLGFQLSMMYLRLEDYPSAKAELERLLKLAPNYSNARWYLATIYEVEGNLAAAIAEVEKVAVLNPDNQAVAFRLENLRAGLLAAQMPEPVEEGEAAETE
jgi:Tfp pilus assembly protein PilF